MSNFINTTYSINYGFWKNHVNFHAQLSSANNHTISISNERNARQIGTSIRCYSLVIGTIMYWLGFATKIPIDNDSSSLCLNKNDLNNWYNNVRRNARISKDNPYTIQESTIGKIKSLCIFDLYKSQFYSFEYNLNQYGARIVDLTEFYNSILVPSLQELKSNFYLETGKDDEINTGATYKRIFEKLSALEGPLRSGGCLKTEKSKYDSVFGLISKYAHKGEDEIIKNIKSLLAIENITKNEIITLRYIFPSIEFDFQFWNKLDYLWNDDEKKFLNKFPRVMNYHLKKIILERKNHFIDSIGPKLTERIQAKIEDCIKDGSLDQALEHIESAKQLLYCEEHFTNIKDCSDRQKYLENLSKNIRNINEIQKTLNKSKGNALDNVDLINRVLSDLRSYPIQQLKKYEEFLDELMKKVIIIQDIKINLRKFVINKLFDFTLDQLQFFQIIGKKVQSQASYYDHITLIPSSEKLNHEYELAKIRFEKECEIVLSKKQKNKIDLILQNVIGHIEMGNPLDPKHKLYADFLTTHSSEMQMIYEISAFMTGGDIETRRVELELLQPFKRIVLIDLYKNILYMCIENKFRRNLKNKLKEVNEHSGQIVNFLGYDKMNNAKLLAFNILQDTSTMSIENLCKSKISLSSISTFCEYMDFLAPIIDYRSSSGFESFSTNDISLRTQYNSKVIAFYEGYIAQLEKVKKKFPSKQIEIESNLETVNARIESWEKHAVVLASLANGFCEWEAVVKTYDRIDSFWSKNLKRGKSAQFLQKLDEVRSEIISESRCADKKHHSIELLKQAYLLIPDNIAISESELRQSCPKDLQLDENSVHHFEQLMSEWDQLNNEDRLSPLVLKKKEEVIEAFQKIQFLILLKLFVYVLELNSREKHNMLTQIAATYMPYEKNSIKLLIKTLVECVKDYLHEKVKEIQKVMEQKQQEETRIKQEQKVREKQRVLAYNY